MTTYLTPAARLARAHLAPDSPLLPEGPRRQLREERYPNGEVYLTLDGVTVGFTAKHPLLRGEWELWWMTADGQDNSAFVRGAAAAAARLRDEVMREPW